MKETQIPKFVLAHKELTSRQWKALKRRQLRAVIAAVEEYRCGCAYCPDYRIDSISTLDKTLRAMKESHSVKNWGR